jgi:endoglucanase
MTWYRFRTALAACSLLLGCDDGGKACAADEVARGELCMNTFESFEVRVNSVGYLPARVKRATFKGGSGPFRVVRAGGEVAYQGTASDPMDSDETAERGLRVADFSSFGETGSFHIEADGVGRSPAFRIADDVYVGVVLSLMQGLYGQRCGTRVAFEFDGSSFQHAACHLDDAWLDFYGEPKKKQPTLYGWHDAGDYGKYSTNGAFAVAMMLLAWEQFQPGLAALDLEIPEHGGALPDFLAECRFQLSWLASMQLADGSVADRVTTAQFDGDVSPESSTARRRLSPATMGATTYFVGTMARAARAFEPYDPELAASYRDAALRSFQFLIDQPAIVTPGADVQREFTGGYWSAGRGGMFWAATEVWETMGDAAALERAESLAADVNVTPFWDWSDLTNLGAFTYLLSKRDGRDPSVVEELTGRLATTVATIQANVEGHPYGRPLGGQYWWGTNGTVARTAMNVAVYDALAPDPAHLDVIELSLDNLLGRNFYGRSYVTGLGQHPPQYPHHRPSQADANPDPWPGLLIGGPWSDAGQLAATAWKDESANYQANEIAINWNAAMIYAAASLLPKE